MKPLALRASTVCSATKHYILDLLLPSFFTEWTCPQVVTAPSVPSAGQALTSLGRRQKSCLSGCSSVEFESQASISPTRQGTVDFPVIAVFLIWPCPFRLTLTHDTSAECSWQVFQLISNRPSNGRVSIQLPPSLNYRASHQRQSDCKNIVSNPSPLGMMSRGVHYSGGGLRPEVR